MILLEICKGRISHGRNRISGRIILKRIFIFEWEEVKWIGLSQDGDGGFAFVNMVRNIFFPQKWEGNLWLYEKVTFPSTLLYITQSINTYIDPVCPDRLTLRYCSCNTYLLQRRAELKAAPGSTCLMRNWTLGNNEPLAVPTYMSGILSCYALKGRNNWPLFEVTDSFALRKLSVSVFYAIHKESVIMQCLSKWKNFISLCLIQTR
jgi:hypothetical protein